VGVEAGALEAFHERVEIWGSWGELMPDDSMLVTGSAELGFELGATVHGCLGDPEPGVTERGDHVIEQETGAFGAGTVNHRE
jgi:hypothetical protein